MHTEYPDRVLQYFHGPRYRYPSVDKSIGDFVSGKNQPLYIALKNGSLAETYGPVGIAVATIMREAWVSDSGNILVSAELADSCNMTVLEVNSILDNFIQAEYLLPLPMPLNDDEVMLILRGMFNTYGTAHVDKIIAKAREHHE